ncbi:MAG TPA: hypothetical protein VJ901_00290 [Thermoanaerobaculia bacterium]|nr:hypothetical protein [Thermoanaerobaculia bacterium]
MKTPLCARVTSKRARAGAGSRPWHFDEVMEECIRFVDAFRHTCTNQTTVIPDIERRKNNRTPGS